MQKSDIALLQTGDFIDFRTKVLTPRGLDNIEQAIAALADVAENHKAGLENVNTRLDGVENSLQQILLILTGGTKTND